MSTLDSLLEMQKEFNDLFYDTECMSSSEKEDATKSLALALYTEVGDLVSTLNCKDHHVIKVDADRTKILFEAVDIFRYTLAILNTWDVDSLSFLTAFKDKDIFLKLRHKIYKDVWDGISPVVIVDMDDAIVDFRNGFANWLIKKHDVHPDIESKEYYFISDLVGEGFNPETVFQEFVSEGGFAKLSPINGALEFLDELKEKGYWIQILTARPKDNLRCFYDTYRWLSENKVSFNRVDFSSEKFVWCAQSPYYDEQRIEYAIDDSPKHIHEYAMHGIKVYAPKMSYNIHLADDDNVTMFDSFNDIEI